MAKILLYQELSVLSSHVLAVAVRASLHGPLQPQRDGRAEESPVSVHHAAHASPLAATTAVPLFTLEVAVSAVLCSVRRVASVGEKAPCSPSYS